MSNPYTTQVIANYNTSPPADDASAVASNQLFWSKHKDKLADPIKVLTEAINTEALAAFGKLPWFAVNAQTALYTVLAADERKLITGSGTFTITLIAAVTAGAGFTVAIKNIGTGVITIDGNGTETIDLALTVVLGKRHDGVVLFCDGANWLIVSDNRTSYEAAINEAKGADIASAATTDIGAATGNYVEVTGTTTITALGTVQAGTRRVVRFTGALILTHNATSLILPGSANITTAADDRAEFISLGAGNWLCTNFQLAASIGGNGALINIQTFTITGTWTPTAGTVDVVVEVRGGGGGGGDGTSSPGGGGGGGGGQGGRSVERILAASLGATEAVTIGAAGAAGAPNGGTGGTSSFGGPVLVQATGGTGGIAGVSSGEGGRGGNAGVGTLGNLNLTGQAGMPGGGGDGAVVDGNGGTGGGEGGGNGGAIGGIGGFAGANGGGGGGGIADVPGQGAAGGAGYVIVWEYS